jgi:predicted RNase H-like HicB family nuclease
MKLKAIIHPAEEGGYWAEVPALPGCITEGDSMDEVVNNLQDAIQGWLEVAIKNITGSHHIYEKPDENKILSIPVHRNQDLKIGTLKAIMKIAQLSEDDL